MDLLSEGIRGIVRYFVEHPYFLGILARDGQAWGLHSRGSAGQSGALKGAKLVTGVVEQGMDEGVFIKSDPALVAASVTAVLQVQLAVLLSREDESDADQVADQILVFLRRLLCGEGDVDAEHRAA